MPINSRFPRLRPSGLVAATMLSIASGCSVWNTPEPSGVPRLPQPQMSRDSVGIEVATVTLNFDQGRELEEILRRADEQIMPARQRRHLAANGIRVGRLGTQLPGPLRLLLLEAADRREHPTADTFGAGQDQQRFIQCRTGKRHSIELWGTVAKLGVEHFDGDTALSETYDDALCQFAIRCAPQKNCCATIKLTPEIEHGKLRQSFVAQNGSFHMEPRRDQVVYEDMTIEFKLSAGETAVVTCSDAEAGVGRSFFRNTESTRQKILLIRLAQTQLDEMFVEDEDIQ